jgi:cytochrome c oxidase assembly protein subunit 17
LPITDLIPASSTATSTNNLAADLKPKGEAAAKAKVYTTSQHLRSTPSDRSPQPCCVCKDEKAARDECMLFSNAADPQADCQNMIQKYKTCMQGYGFSLP